LCGPDKRRAADANRGPKHARSTDRPA
jgi:hypothetical protein